MSKLITEYLDQVGAWQLLMNHALQANEYRVNYINDKNVTTLKVVVYLPYVNELKITLYLP